MMKIIYKGIEFEVEYDYQPEEKEVRYYSDGSGYPGCPASLDITEITHKGVSFWDLLEGNLDEIEELVYETLKEF